MNNTVTIIGNLTADPELRLTKSGTSVANVTIASTPRTFNRQKQDWEDGEALFLKGTVWKDLAEHVTDSLVKGSRVIATGKLIQRSYEVEGQKRTSYELEIEEIGPSLRYATAALKKSRGYMQGDQGTQDPQPAADPWGNGDPPLSF
jgi:single-strand DNA-binding protein